jgi:hypothetical protein
MATVASTHTLSVDDLLTKGYFADRIIPPVNSLGIAPAIPDIFAHVLPKALDVINRTKGAKLPRGRCVRHSVPKRKHLRRMISIPNPFHQAVLTDEVVNSWPDLQKFCAQSPIAITTPTVSSKRAVDPEYELGDLPGFRAQRSIGARYLLKADLARYYPSIYTHSIPWALHGKVAARADKNYKLVGNRLDLWLRETQDKQTGGIPIGPDTSFIVGEIIATAIDLQLKERIPGLRGARTADDYYLYFPTISEAEGALATLHDVARRFELEMNDPKTEIVALPEALEPAWKSDLRSLRIRDSGSPQSTDLLTLFDRAFEHAKRFPTDSVLTYAAKQVLSANISPENWEFCEALLLKAALAEPTMLSVVCDIYTKYAAYHSNIEPVTNAVEGICAYHAPLQQGNEVAWALWLAKQLGVSISKPIGDRIAKIDDDVVALITLDLNKAGLLDASGFPKWRAYMSTANLYDDHWLLAYEAHEQGWLPPRGGTDYVGADPFFAILRAHNVRFYGFGLIATSSFYDYTDSDEVTVRVDEVEVGEDIEPPELEPGR